MKTVHEAMGRLNSAGEELQRRSLITSDQYFALLADTPSTAIRNVFQVFHDLVMGDLGDGLEEYPDDPESIGFMYYDCSKLFVEDSDHPFFADRLFANRLVRQVEAFRQGAQQNKIYIFEGPPGCGKSTFLNNLLRRFQTYANTFEGQVYETVWRLRPELLGGGFSNQLLPMLEKIITPGSIDFEPQLKQQIAELPDREPLLVPCPSHDNPILLIPRAQRRDFYDELFSNDEFKWRLFTEKQYEWVFSDIPCTICSSMYAALLELLGSPGKVFRSVLARPYVFDRRLGQGISVYNPGDRPHRDTVLSNTKLQEGIDNLLRDSNLVRYFYSPYAKTNNGIHALMDIKSHNTKRLIELHNIISEGVHKVEDIEENVNSLFLALMNPEDKANIEGFQSFSDRIEYIKIPYVLDVRTEVEIYRSTFGAHIDTSFLPRVLHNFARVILATRLAPHSEGMMDWVQDREKYSDICDDKLLLLKMEVYTGYIPLWLGDEERKRFTAKRRRRILAESESEGVSGLSGRDSIKIFHEFYSTFAREDRLITMAMLKKYFSEIRADLAENVPEGFIDGLVRLYDYTVLGEVKECLYYFHEEQIDRDIQDYLFAINFEPGDVETCTYTGNKLEISEEFFASIEARLLGPEVSDDQRATFRAATQRHYASHTLAQEIGVAGRPITETELFADSKAKYIHNLKDRALDPFLNNDNFRRAVRDYDTEGFRTYDKRIRDDVRFLMTNLVNRRRYSEHAAREMCTYVIDNVFDLHAEE